MSDTTITIYRGDSRIIPLTIREDGIPVDLTGDTIWFTVKENIEDADSEAIIQKQITVHTSPTEGQTEIVLLHGDTELEPGEYPYDIQRVAASGAVRTFYVGVFVVLAEVTRSII